MYNYNSIFILTIFHYFISNILCYYTKYFKLFLLSLFVFLAFNYTPIAMVYYHNKIKVVLPLNECWYTNSCRK